MTSAPNLALRQAQGLVLTPQLQQAIKLLQMGHQELADFVAEAVESNPLLVADDGSAEEARPAADERPATLDQVFEGAAEAPLDTASGSLADDHAGESDSWAGLKQSKSNSFSQDDDDPTQRIEATGTLRDHLIAQVAVEFADPVDRAVALQIAESLEETGWLAEEGKTIPQRLGVSEIRFEAILAVFRRLDPAGCGARTLAECLAPQLAERNRLDPAMQALLDHLHLVAERNFGALMRVCGVDAEDVRDMIVELKRLDPKPGLKFDRSEAQTLVPDILMRPTATGLWQVELNPDTLPRLIVDRRYSAMVGDDKTAKTYLTQRGQEASWLVKALDQRAQTILKVAQAIVRRQHGFFRQGVEGLRPLVLREIAEQIGMHESTVSRVVAGKYILTNRGQFELRYFFTVGLASNDGEALSAEAVRHKIKGLIESESPKSILSDDRIAEILNEQGVAVARRTVAKYREAMRIPSSSERRRAKAV